MDSRQLYKAAEHLGSILTWDNDWIHFGTGSDIKLDLIGKLIEEFLVDEHINLVFERNNSGTYTRSEVIKQIAGLLGKHNFTLWNESLDKAIRFQSIGVLLKGEKHPIT